MAVTTISLSSVKNYTDDLTKDKFDSLNFVSFDGGELATVSGNSIYNIILGDNDTAGSLTYRISAAENDILELNNKLGDGFSDTSTVTQQFSTAKERITVAEENAQVAASTLDNFLTVADGKDFLFLLDDLTVPVGRLDKLTDGFYMFYNKKYITNWSVNLPLLSKGEQMFNGSNLKKWTIDLPSLSYAPAMFAHTPISIFKSNLPVLSYAKEMFFGCGSLVAFQNQLPNLTNGYTMFLGTSLTDWNIDMPLLVHGEGMFQASKLANFAGDLSSLEYGRAMFCNTRLSIFNQDISFLLEGDGMFEACGVLTSFSSALTNLIKGDNMFKSCKLDLPSVQNIAEGINDLASQSKSGSITIGMAADLRGNSELTEALAVIRAKGWTVTEQYNA